MSAPPRGRGEEGLALLGSLLLVSMLAVMSTTFILIMAVDVRIGQSHLRSTQANYNVESAAQLAAYLLTWDAGARDAALNVPKDSVPPLQADSTAVIYTWADGEDSLSISVARPSGFPVYKRLLIIRGFSGKASFDSYEEILLPTTDPRLYYAISAGIRLELDAGCRVIGGEGVRSTSLYPAAGFDPPFVDDSFDFESPSAAEPRLIVAGNVAWGAGFVENGWLGVLDVRTGGPVDTVPDSAVSRVPRILLSDERKPPVGSINYYYYEYMVTGSGTWWRAREVTGTSQEGTVSWGSSGYSAGGSNPLGILVWRGTADEIFSSSFTLNGTLVCLNEYTDLTIRDGNVTITGQTNPYATSERYPALVSRGDVNIAGWGTRSFNGLVYVRETFYANPTGDWTTILGALVAGRVRLRARTTVDYRSWVHENAPAFLRPDAAAGRVFPAPTLHRRRYLHAPWGY